ncbi:MAG TPA: FGGY-family carbohydrate kinase, partial [Acidimicrobiales bacterium]|nr:FGGY-family carbohydrate kinase [Acidimicrobiales bacterium]
AANAFLMQFQADVLGVPVDVAGHIESTALGSGLMAGLAVGVWPDRSAVAALRRCARRFEPSISADERDARYSRWRQAVARAADWSDERG